MVPPPGLLITVTPLFDCAPAVWDQATIPIINVRGSRRIQEFISFCCREHSETAAVWLFIGTAHPTVRCLADGMPVSVLTGRNDRKYSMIWRMRAAQDQ